MFRNGLGADVKADHHEQNVPESSWPKPRRGNCDCRVMGDGIDFVKGLVEIVVVIYHEQNTQYPGQSHCGRRLDNLSSRYAVTVSGGGLAVLWDFVDRDLGSPHRYIYIYI